MKYKIADKRFIELIEKFLKAGVMEKGKYHTSELGTPQGGLCKALHNNPYAK